MLEPQDLLKLYSYMCVGDVGCVYVPAYFLVIQEITKLVLLCALPPYLSLYKGEKHKTTKLHVWPSHVPHSQPD